MKDVINFVKSVWNNRRQRAVFSLFLWLAFFVVIFIMIDVPKTPVTETKRQDENKLSANAIENFKEVENYEFSYLITIKENNLSNIYKIDGTYYNKKFFLEESGQNYYYDGDILYLVNDDYRQLKEFKSIDPNNLFNQLDINVLTNDVIYTFITSSEKKEQTTYKDNSAITSYTYKSYDDRTINIVVSEHSNIISNIEMNFSSYLDRKYDDFTVNITYKNVNNIVKYDKNYDNYQIIKEGE